MKNALLWIVVLVFAITLLSYNTDVQAGRSYMQEALRLLEQARNSRISEGKINLLNSAKASLRNVKHYNGGQPAKAIGKINDAFNKISQGKTREADKKIDDAIRHVIEGMKYANKGNKTYTTTKVAGERQWKGNEEIEIEREEESYSKENEEDFLDKGLNKIKGFYKKIEEKWKDEGKQEGKYKQQPGHTVKVLPSGGNTDKTDRIDDYDSKEYERLVQSIEEKYKRDMWDLDKQYDKDKWDLDRRYQGHQGRNEDGKLKWEIQEKYERQRWNLEDRYDKDKWDLENRYNKDKWDLERKHEGRYRKNVKGRDTKKDKAKEHERFRRYREKENEWRKKELEKQYNTGMSDIGRQCEDNMRDLQRKFDNDMRNLQRKFEKSKWNLEKRCEKEKWDLGRKYEREQWNIGKRHWEEELPRGLAERRERGWDLPPGWQDKLIVGEVIPYSIYKEAEKLPAGYGQDDTDMLILDNKVIEILKKTKEIVNISNY